MLQRKRNPGNRPAFTLIELMVVITIIAILVALLAGAVIKAVGKGPELQTSSEIDQMQSKLSALQRQFNVKYLPSRLHLSKTGWYPNKSVGGSLDADSVAYLQARFGKGVIGSQTIDWNGDGNANEELYLEGEQCFVFHLGGLPLTANGQIIMTGFAQNSSNPASAGGSGHRDGPFYEFQSNRLKAVTSAFNGPNFPVQPGGTYGAFPEYLDPWIQRGGVRQPYAYFVSSLPEGVGQYDKYATSDCPLLGLTAYQNGVGGPFLNPSSCQIISAGKDGLFGAGGTNWSRTGTTDPNGADDQSNFSAHVLGTAP